MDGEIWSDDLLNRERQYEYIYALIRSRVAKDSARGSFVVNVDAKWGQGKTFFVDRMYRKVLAEGHPAVFINAWKFDYIDDPYTHVVAEIDQYFTALLNNKNSSDDSEFKKTLRTYSDAVIANAGKILWTALKGGAKRASRWAIAEGADEIVELVEQYAPKSIAETSASVVEDVEANVIAVNDKFIDGFIQKRILDFEETKKSLGDFQLAFKGALEHISTKSKHQLPMFIFIDELDRCRPTYAISMLERIKHLFDIPNVAFVIATDTTSLGASIKAVYGSEFDSQHYLSRFFHRSFKLPTGSNDNIVRQYIEERSLNIERLTLPGKKRGVDAISLFVSKTANIYDLSVRQIKQTLRTLDDIIDATDPTFKLELVYLYTLICEFAVEGRVRHLTEMRLGERASLSQTDWTYEDMQGNQSYQLLFQKIYDTRSIRLDDALQKFQRERDAGVGAYAHYLWEFLRAEIIAKKEADRSGLTEFASYEWLVTHAYNSAIEY